MRSAVHAACPHCGRLRARSRGRRRDPASSAEPDKRLLFCRWVAAAISPCRHEGDFPGAPRHAFLLRYEDGLAGLTTGASVQQSIKDLSQARASIMTQQQGLAMPLLGGDKPMGNESEVGVFGQAGSAQGGGYARFASSSGFAILAGVSYGQEDYDDAQIDNSLMGAVALRYLRRPPCGVPSPRWAAGSPPRPISPSSAPT